METSPVVSEILVHARRQLTAVDGRNFKGMQYETGNPFTAERMTRLAFGGRPLCTLAMLYEDESGKAIFLYDLRSSLFGQFGDEQITQVGRCMILQRCGRDRLTHSSCQNFSGGMVI